MVSGTLKGKKRQFGGYNNPPQFFACKTHFARTRHVAMFVNFLFSNIQIELKRLDFYFTIYGSVHDVRKLNALYDFRFYICVNSVLVGKKKCSCRAMYRYW